MSEVDGATLIARSLKQQGIDHLFGIVGFPVTAIAAAAQKEGVAYLGMPQRAERRLCGRGLRLSHRPPRRLPHRDRPSVVHGLAGLANAQQNCWPMILIGGASETYRGGMGAFQEERQVLIASPFCKFAHGIESVQRIPYYVEMATRHAIYGRPGAPIWTCPTTSSGQMRPRPSRRGRTRRRTAAHGGAAENVEAALNLLERPSGRSLSSARAWLGRAARTRSAPSSSTRNCLSCAHRWARRDAGRPSTVGRAARTLALQQADVIFLMGRAIQLDLSFRLPPRYAKNVKIVQLDHRARGDRPTTRRPKWRWSATQGHRQPTQQGTRQASVVPCQGLAVAAGDRQKDGRLMRRKSGRRSMTMLRRPATTARCAMSPPGCRGTRF